MPAAVTVSMLVSLSTPAVSRPVTRTLPAAVVFTWTFRFVPAADLSDVKKECVVAVKAVVKFTVQSPAALSVIEATLYGAGQQSCKDCLYVE